MINAEMIGKNIRYLCKSRKISQGKMAEDLGMYQADISNLERAMGGSGKESQKRMCRIYI